MAILIADNFSYLGRKPLDGRLTFETIADMASTPESTIYEGIIAYNKEDKKYYTFDPANSVDPTVGKWKEFTVGGNASIEEYDRGIQYKKDTLLVKDGKLYFVPNDFVSDNTASSINESFDLDLAAGNMVPAFVEDGIYQPIAPEKHTLDIESAGIGYVINDIVETLTSGIFAKVLTVGDNGEILTVENAPDETSDKTTGSGAQIKVNPIYSMGYDGQWYDLEMPEIDVNAKLAEDIKSNVEVGGAPSGTMFAKDLTFTEFAKMILRKAIIPKIVFNATGAGIHEIGTTVNGSTMKLIISNIADITSTINKIEFLVDGNVVDTPTLVSGQDNYVYDYTDPITQGTTFSAKLTYDNNQTVSAKADMKFVHASYHGPVSTLTPDETTIVSLTKTVKDTKAFTWNGANLDDERFCYAYPSSFGNLTSIKDANNFEYMSSYTKSNITIDGTDYNVYVLTDPVTIAGAKQAYA